MHVFLSATEAAERVGITRVSLYKRGLPEPEAMIGQHKGWLPETIDAWEATIPGRGKWDRATRRKEQEKDQH